MGKRVYPNLDAFFRANPETTMQSLCEELDISLPMMSALRWGLRSPRLNKAIKLAQRCNIPIESLDTETLREKAS